MSTLFDPLRIGDIQLATRICMAPLTRNRASPGQVPNGAADLVAFGKAFIANPDLGLRLRLGAALNALDTDRLYGGGAAGYTDYPALHATDEIGA